jgi:arginyl-tRNA synthetase
MWRDGVTEVVEEIVANGTALARRFIASSATMKVRDEEMDAVAENLAIASTIVDCVKRARRQDYRFSFENAFKMEQENALLLQVHSPPFDSQSRSDETQSSLEHRRTERGTLVLLVHV